LFQVDAVYLLRVVSEFLEGGVTLFKTCFCSSIVVGKTNARKIFQLLSVVEKQIGAVDGVEVCDEVVWYHCRLIFVQSYKKFPQTLAFSMIIYEILPNHTKCRQEILRAENIAFSLYRNLRLKKLQKNFGIPFFGFIFAATNPQPCREIW
jgi:ABC-type long-subunit fatty acid transport system fused permease/ATPase subunit